MRAYGLSRTAEQARLKAMYPGDPAAADKALADWDKANPTPTTDVAKVADHIDHIRKLAGIDHIGLGGDYDGMDSAPVGMEDVSGYPRCSSNWRSAAIRRPTSKRLRAATCCAC